MADTSTEVPKQQDQSTESNSWQSNAAQEAWSGNNKSDAGQPPNGSDRQQPQQGSDQQQQPKEGADPARDAARTSGEQLGDKLKNGNFAQTGQFGDQTNDVRKAMGDNPNNLQDVESGANSRLQGSDYHLQMQSQTAGSLKVMEASSVKNGSNERVDNTTQSVGDPSKRLPARPF